MSDRSPRVLLGVSGGIAAYKAPELVRRLRDAGFEVTCALTPSASHFVSPLSLEVVSGHPVRGEEYFEPRGTGVEEHITLGEWADAVLLAPCTADLLAQMAQGLAPNFLTTTLLAWDGPLIVAPAMHPRMWNHSATQHNVATLRQRGVRVVGPDRGPLASGEEGVGRLVDPPALVAALREALRAQSADDRWRGRRVLVTAGPTREPIDTVRYLGNRSSGRMGFALAAAAARRGAKVTLVSGPVTLETPLGVDHVAVQTALEMEEAVRAAGEDAEVVFMTAAVADYRPAHPAERKLKKGVDGLDSIALVENPDILAGLAERRGRAKRPILVGFGAETEALVDHGRRKLARKGCDYLVVNDVSRTDIGFGTIDNEVTVLTAEGGLHEFDRQSKEDLAGDLLDLVAERLPVGDPS